MSMDPEQIFGEQDMTMHAWTLDDEVSDPQTCGHCRCVSRARGINTYQIIHCCHCYTNVEVGEKDKMDLCTHEWKVYPDLQILEIHLECDKCGYVKTYHPPKTGRTLR